MHRPLLSSIQRSAINGRRTLRALNEARLSAIRTDPVPIVVDGIAALDDPAALPMHLNFLCDRKHYPDAARLIEKILTPKPSMNGRRLIQILHDTPSPWWTRLYRVAQDVRLIRPRNDQSRVAAYSLEEAVDATRGPKRKLAWIAIHVMGHVRSAQGVEPIEQAAPGLWPHEANERLALVLYLLVARMRGESFPVELEPIP